MSNAAALYQKLQPVLDGLSPTRARVEAVFNNWRTDSVATDGPANFIHAVMSTYDDFAGLDPAPNRATSRDALGLALASLETVEKAHPCFCAMVGAGLFDHQLRPVAPWLKDLARLDAETHDRLLAESAALLSDPDDNFRLDLAELSEPHHIQLGRKILIARSLFCLAPADARKFLHATLQRSTQEAMTVPDDFFSDPGTLLPALLHGRRRMCLIRTFDQNGDPTTGTGFLIGPSAVLTNLHVVSALPDHIERAEHIDDEKLLIQFDFSETTALAQADSSVYLPVSDWCLAKGELTDLGPDIGYWWDDQAQRQTWLNAVKTKLDYAVVKLSGAPGLQRGWYTLSTARRRRPTGSWALHHPASREHTLTRGQVKYTVDFGHRMFHTASTTGGSSGGLILDQDGDPMGLHYLALDARRPPDEANPNEKNEVLNVAIGLREIAQALEEDGKVEAISTPSVLKPAVGCIDGDLPVFGRASFFDALTEFWTSKTKRIMRVDLVGDATQLRRAGKTFSKDIIKSMFRGPEHHHMVFRAGDLKVDAQRMAADALATFADDLVKDLPDAPDTTTPAYVRRLVSFVGRAISERLPNHSVWVVLDDLDKHNLSDASGREFLATLYNQVDEIPNLRIVLIGLPEGLAISGIEAENEIVTQIMPQDLTELDQKFITWLKEHSGGNAVMLDEGYAFLANIVTSYAVGTAPLEALSEFVSKHVIPVIERGSGSAGQHGEDP